MTTRIWSKCWRIGSYPLHLAILLASAVGSLAEEAPVKAPPAHKPATFADPVSTYRFYINAVRKTDPAAAKSCFTINDNKDNKSGALDVMLGLWISTRRLDQIATKKLGAETAREIQEPVGFSRGDLSDAALNLTEKRLTGSLVKFLGDDMAELVIKWQDGDDYPNDAFEFRQNDPIRFSKVDGVWRIDANKIGGLSGEDFKEGTWGAAFRDHVKIANEASDRLTKGTLKGPEELKEYLAREISAAEKRYKEAVEEPR